MNSSNRIGLGYYFGMAENVIAELRQVLQDVVAPDLKSLGAKMDGLQKQVELSEKSVNAQIEAFRAELNAFRAEIRSEFQAQRTLLQNEVLRETARLRERLSSLEASIA